MEEECLSYATSSDGVQGQSNFSVIPGQCVLSVFAPAFKEIFVMETRCTEPSHHPAGQRGESDTAEEERCPLCHQLTLHPLQASPCTA